MNFNDLQNVCRKNKITATSVAEHLGLSYYGFKKALNNKTLAIKHVEEICNLMCITPDEFFGLKKNGNMQTQNGGIGNTQFMDAGTVSVLQDQLKKKDEQISMLLQLLNK